MRAIHKNPEIRRINRCLKGSNIVIVLFASMFLSLTGCKTASEYRLEANKTATALITSKQKELLQEDEDFSIERPADILRRRLLIEQKLPYKSETSLGSDKLKPIENWPEDNMPLLESSSSDSTLSIEPGVPLKLSYLQALQTGALNNPTYQTMKEDIFRTALAYDLKLDAFRYSTASEVQSSYSADRSAQSTGGQVVKGTEQTGSLDIQKTLMNGTKFAVSIAADLVSLLTQGRTSSMGITGDASVSIPLLRGSGRDIVTEPLTQAERNLIYSMYDFETYKKTFAVQIATNYLSVLQQSNQVENAAENYRNLIESARRIRMLADAGRVTEIDVDQAVQKELAARIRWISAMEAYKTLLDSFKNLIGLPPDSNIELDDSILKNLSTGVSTILSYMKEESQQDSSQELVPPGHENAGPMEMDEKTAIKLGLDNRFDLRVLEGKVYDAQRGVIIAADALGAELTLLGSANLGQSRSLATANLKDSSLDINEGIYSGLLTLDLPLDRTSERNAYRDSYITLERAIREFQKLEDNIKLSVRNSLRDMLEAREGLITQTKAVELAEKRVKSVNLFLEAGRAEIRDLLDAQDSLLTARNALTAALVNYRSAELEFQRDTGIMKIDKNGLLIEYNSKGKDNG